MIGLMHQLSIDIYTELMDHLEIEIHNVIGLEHQLSIVIVLGLMDHHGCSQLAAEHTGNSARSL